MKKVVVGSTFGVYPPRAGGQLRILKLYGEVARLCPVDVIALVDHNERPSRREIAPGLVEIRVPKSAEHAIREAELQALAGVSVTDVAFSRLHPLTPAFSDAVREAFTPGSVLVASHPYAFPAMRLVDEDAEWWYDAHNVEVDLKAPMLSGTRVGKRLLAWARQVERQCCREASRVLTSCAEDRDRLGALYRLPPDRVTVVANGIDTSSVRFVNPTARRALRRRLRLTQPLALFVGSWHEPNVQAAHQILRFAGQLPEVKFAIVGSVGIPLAETPRPANVDLFGVVDDELKQAVSMVAEVALNPMLQGSGTNMKMLEYLAAGIPVISTRVGARGLGLDLETDLRCVRPEDFPAAVRMTLSEEGASADLRALNSRRKMEKCFDWKAVCAGILATVEARRSPRGRSGGVERAVVA